MTFIEYVVHFSSSLHTQSSSKTGPVTCSAAPAHTPLPANMAILTPNLNTSTPAISPADRRREKEPSSKDSPPRGRGRDREGERDNSSTLDYIHSRDPNSRHDARPVLAHRDSSREGRRHHEYRYYEPERPRQRPRSAERKSPPQAARGGGGGSGGSGGKPGRRMSVSNADGHQKPRRMSVSNGDGHRERDSNKSRRNDHDTARPPRTRRPSFVDHSHSQSHNNRGRSRSRSRSRDRNNNNNHHRSSTSKRRSTAQNLGKAALTAGAVEAARHRGSLRGGAEQGDAWKRVATAAVGAAAIDAAATKMRGKDPRDTGKKTVLGASLGGLLVEGVVNRLRV